jgi:hypothetical protein
MFDIFFLASLFLFSILCFFEFIVFNEEILLALCFFSFVFFLFNSLGDVIFANFTERAQKFESDLLLSFVNVESLIRAQFLSFLASRNIAGKFEIFSTLLTHYFKFFEGFVNKFISHNFFSLCLSTISEIIVLEKRLLSQFQKKCVSALLYPLIFKTTSNNILQLPMNTYTQVNAKLKRDNIKVAALKSLSA